MTLLETIAAWAGMPADKLRAVIAAGAAAAPDLASFASLLLAKLDEAFTPQSLADLAAALPTEARAILLGHLDPRNHPSDAA